MHSFEKVSLALKDLDPFGFLAMRPLELLQFLVWFEDFMIFFKIIPRVARVVGRSSPSRVSHAQVELI